MSDLRTAALDRTRAAWGDQMPDWVEALARACDAQSQNSVASRLGYSPAVVSNTLNNKYGGDMSAVEQAIRGTLMAETVECPVIGEMSVSTCSAHQKADWAPRRAMIHAACRSGCPHSRINGGSNV